MTPAMQRLALLAEEFDAIDDARRDKLHEIKAAIRAVDNEGLNSRADIILVSKRARQTVYDALDEDDPDRATSLA